MYFKYLKDDYERYSNKKIDRIENKQHLNISHRAYSIIINDSEVFDPENTQVNSGKISSHFINHIFEHFRESAESSIACTLRDKEIELKKTLKPMHSKDEKDTAIELLKEEYKTQIENNIIKRLKRQKGTDHSFYVRINQNNLAYLASDDGQEEGKQGEKVYKNRIGDYLKAIIEEYCEKAYADRECIYYKSILGTVNLAIANQKLLKITLKNEVSFDGIIKYTIMYMKPFGIERDSESLYNYLAGYICPNREGPWKQGAIRLTSVKECIDLEYSGFISKDNKDDIAETIKNKGVQYLSSKRLKDKIIIRFTEAGEELYQRMLHLRPLYTEKLDDLTYEFDCTPLQAEYYFFKFGQDAKVIEPRSLAEKFQQKYKAAFDLYQDGD